jgi:hypothetical protein
MKKELEESIKEFEAMLDHVKQTESKEAYEVVLKAYQPSIDSMKLKIKELTPC